MQVHILQTAFVLTLAVAKADMVKVDAAVRHFGDSVRRADDIAFFVQNFHDTLAGGTGNGNHNEYHRKHHQTGQNLNGICHKAHELPGGQCLADDHSCAEPGNQDQTGIHTKLHQRHIKRQSLFCPGKIPVDILRNAGELLNLVIFPDKGLYHTDAVEVFLCHVVQLIIGFEHPFENGVYPCHNEIQSHAQHRNCRQIDQ